jgi:circadian clock protein KaiB
MKHRHSADGNHRAIEAAAAEAAAACLKLRLYVIGNTQQSNRAIVNTRRICDEHLPGRHLLEIVNLHDRPDLAAKDQIIAAPTLVKVAPLPQRRFIGDMSDTAKILGGLGLFVPSPSSPG